MSFLGGAVSRCGTQSRVWQGHSGTNLKRALTELGDKQEWSEYDRLIVITDEQSHDGILPAWTPRAYVVDVARTSTALRQRIDAHRLLVGSHVDYIAAVEAQAAA